MGYLMLKTPVKAIILEMYDFSSICLAELPRGWKNKHFFLLTNQDQVYQQFWIFLRVVNVGAIGPKPENPRILYVPKIYLKNNQTHNLLKSISNI